MSLEKELDSVLSEALPPRRDPPAKLAPQQAKPGAKPAQPTSPQKQKNPQFSDARKALRRPMVNLDAQIHKIDQQLNTTQKPEHDIAQVGNNIKAIEQSFEAMFDPLKQVRAGIKKLGAAAGDLKNRGVEEVPWIDRENNPQAGATPAENKPQAGLEQPDKEDRYMNRIVTGVESSPTDQDKQELMTQAWTDYQKNGGKKNRGEFYHQIVSKLKAGGSLPQGEEEEANNPNIVSYGGMTKQPKPADEQYALKAAKFAARRPTTPTAGGEKMNVNQVVRAYNAYRKAGGKQGSEEFKAEFMKEVGKPDVKESSVQRRKLV